MHILYIKRLLFLVSTVLCISNATSQDKIWSYKLPNGLTVCLNEDHSSQYITAAIVAKVADNTMPKGKEALAHCIEHMLFKGTHELGTNNWEKEKPLYEAVMAQYKKLARTKNQLERRKIKKQISDLTDSASQYIIHGEFYLLQSDIGLGEGFTYYNDYTIFHNTFLPDKLEKWLDLNSHRFTQPVFREFQKELSVISQEYFEKSKDKSSPRWDYIYKALYGKPSSEELSDKVYNISLTDVKEYYDKNYVPENMAVIISGNFVPDEVRAGIENYFSKLPKSKKTVYASTLKTAPLAKREILNAYYDDEKSVTLLFRGAPNLSIDYYPFRVAMHMLTNGFNGIQDSMWHNGMVESYHYNWLKGKNESLYYIYMKPFANQTSNALKYLLMNEIKKIAEGHFGDTALLCAKVNLNKEIDMEKENLFLKVSNMAQYFTYGINMPEEVYSKSGFDSVKREDIMRVLKKYFLNNYVELHPFHEWKNIAMKKDSLEIPKRNYLFQKNHKSVYAGHFDSIPDFNFKMLPFGFDDVFDTTIIKGVKYYSITNRVDKIFHLKLVYKPSGEVNNLLEKINFKRRFEYLFPEGENWSFRQKLSLLGTKYDFSHSSNGTIVLNIHGIDAHLNETLQLFAELFRNPGVNTSGVNRIQDAFMANNKSSKVFPIEADSLASVYRQMFSSVYEVSYYGSLQAEKAYQTVALNLNLKEKKRPVPQNMVDQYDSNMPEIKLWLYTKPSSPKYKMELLVLKNYVFRILWDEIRVANGLAYILGTDTKVPERDSTSGYLYASVRTKDYQIPLASEILTSILKNLPERENAFENAIQQVKNDYLSKFLNPKIAFDYIKDSKNKGMSANSVKDELSNLDKLSLSDLISFYKSQFGNSNVKIEIYGNIHEIGQENFERLKRELELRASL